MRPSENHNQGKQIAVIGAGSFGTALAWLLSGNGHDVKIWTRSKESALYFNEAHGNPEKLPEVRLPESVRYTSSMEEALTDADAAVLVVPSIHIRQTAASMRGLLKSGSLVVDCAKGIEEATLLPLSQVIEQELPGMECCVLSGPSHAEEVGRGMPTAIVAAAKEEKIARSAQNLFMSPNFRVYTSDDLTGVELGGALKNVIALAAGVADGLSYGDNTKAAMITRGIAEITRLGVAVGARAETFAGLTGIGDLIVTCASMHSRNRRAGILIGQGMRPEDACAQVKMVVEGIHSAKAAWLLAQKYEIEMPIITEVYRVLFENKRPAEAVADLMLRDKKAEWRTYAGT